MKLTPPLAIAARIQSKDAFSAGWKGFAALPLAIVHRVRGRVLLGRLVL